MLVLSDRTPETTVLSSSLPVFVQLVDRRLAIARKGLAEARACLALGAAEDAAIVLEKIDEDLQMLCRRLARETRAAAPRRLVRCGPAPAGTETN